MAKLKLGTRVVYILIARVAHAYPTMGSNEELTRTRALRDILAYEDGITIDVEKAVQKIRERSKLIHNELDKYINTLISDIKKLFDQEVINIRKAIHTLKGEGTRLGSSRATQASTVDRTPMYRSTPRPSEHEASLSKSLLSGISIVKPEPLDHFDKKELHFHEGEISEKLFKKLTGYYTLPVTRSIPIVAIPRVLEPSRRAEVKLVKTFRVGEKSETVHALAPVNEDQAWICCGWGSRNISLYDRNGQKKISTTLDIQVS